MLNNVFEICFPTNKHFVIKLQRSALIQLRTSHLKFLGNRVQNGSARGGLLRAGESPPVLVEVPACLRRSEGGAPTIDFASAANAGV